MSIARRQAEKYRTCRRKRGKGGKKIDVFVEKVPFFLSLYSVGAEEGRERRRQSSCLREENNTYLPVLYLTYSRGVFLVGGKELEPSFRVFNGSEVT